MFLKTSVPLLSPKIFPVHLKYVLLNSHTSAANLLYLSTSVLCVWQSLAILFRGVYLQNPRIFVFLVFWIIFMPVNNWWKKEGGSSQPLSSLGDALHSYLIVPFWPLYVNISNCIGIDMNSLEINSNWLYLRIVGVNFFKFICLVDSITGRSYFSDE